MDILTKLQGKVFCNRSLLTGDQGEGLCCTEFSRVTDRAAWGSGGAQCVGLSVESIEPAHHPSLGEEEGRHLQRGQKCFSKQAHDSYCESRVYMNNCSR